MKKILIDKRIGSGMWEQGITAEYIRSEFASVQLGEDVELVIDSPGGSFYMMVTIFNIIRDFTRKNPQRVDTYIQGMAASAASMLALAAKAGNPNNQIFVEDNSIFMIHNSWSIAMGDHSDFENEARELVRVDELQRDIYERRTGKARAAIKKWMAEDTFFYGKEIVENGFADKVIADSTQEENQDYSAVFTSGKNAAIIGAKLALDETKKQMNGDAERVAMHDVAAYLGSPAVTAVDNKIETADKPAEKQGGCMTANELKASDPAVYEEVLELGMQAGVTKERSRVEAHLKMGELAGSLETSAKHIRGGAGISDDTVQTEYFEKRLATKMATDRLDDDPPSLVTPNAEVASKEAQDAFEKETGAKK